jgi:hypothetical protein
VGSSTPFVGGETKSSFIGPGPFFGELSPAVPIHCRILRPSTVAFAFYGTDAETIHPVHGVRYHAVGWINRESLKDCQLSTRGGVRRSYAAHSMNGSGRGGIV